MIATWQAVGAQPAGDGSSDAGAASGHDRGLHAAAPSQSIKNRPSDYENRTLASVRSRKTNRTGLSHSVSRLRGRSLISVHADSRSSRLICEFSRANV